MPVNPADQLLTDGGFLPKGNRHNSVKRTTLTELCPPAGEDLQDDEPNRPSATDLQRGIGLPWKPSGSEPRLLEPTIRANSSAEPEEEVVPELVRRSAAVERLR